MNKQVSLFESKMAEYIGCKYAVFVSSGSTANTILAMYLKDKFWKIGNRGLVYNECKKILKRYLPNDIVLFILKKCFI